MVVCCFCFCFCCWEDSFSNQCMTFSVNMFWVSQNMRLGFLRSQDGVRLRALNKWKRLWSKPNHTKWQSSFAKGCVILRGDWQRHYLLTSVPCKFSSWSWLQLQAKYITQVWTRLRRPDQTESGTRQWPPASTQLTQKASSWVTDPCLYFNCC